MPRSPVGRLKSRRSRLLSDSVALPHGFYAWIASRASSRRLSNLRQRFPSSLDLSTGVANRGEVSDSITRITIENGIGPGETRLREA